MYQLRPCLTSWTGEWRKSCAAVPSLFLVLNTLWPADKVSYCFEFPHHGWLYFQVWAKINPVCFKLLLSGYFIQGARKTAQKSPQDERKLWRRSGRKPWEGITTYIVRSPQGRNWMPIKIESTQTQTRVKRWVLSQPKLKEEAQKSETLTLTKYGSWGDSIDHKMLYFLSFEIILKSQHPHKKEGVVASICIPSSGNVDKGVSLGLNV